MRVFDHGVAGIVMKPITEASNVFSKDIDVASPLEIVTTLHKCDQEIFSGYQHFKSIFHPDVLDTIGYVAKRVAHIIQTGDGVVVLSGCGTSGRLGFIIARGFNERLKEQGQPELYRYIVAGGDKALFTSQEAPEDDPQHGVQELQKVTEGKSKVVFIGITCGLSAPFVAGQLDYCMDHPDVFTPVLLGFNPTSLARNISIEKWDKTFFQVAERLDGRTKNKQGFILNPVVGPEPITGSSRMKSGTATRLLIDAICVAAHTSVFKPNLTWNVSNHLVCYQLISDTVYQQRDAVSKVIKMAGNSLLSGGHIYYLGNDSLGLVGIIDASECPPTYGASLNDIRGFVESGYTLMKNNEGDLSSLGRHYRISVEDFISDISRTLTELDTVIMLNSGTSFELPSYLRDQQCKKVLLTFEKVNKGGFDAEIFIGVPLNELSELIGSEQTRDIRQLFCEMAVKWCLNSVSTGAHILKGKVYENLMVDVTVSNNKLFHRAVGILEKLANLTTRKARRYLLMSIYETDNLSLQQEEATVTDHILIATPKVRIVPVALVSAVSGISVREAGELVARQPVIRTLIEDCLKRNTRANVTST